MSSIKTNNTLGGAACADMARSRTIGGKKKFLRMVPQCKSYKPNSKACAIIPDTSRDLQSSSTYHSSGYPPVGGSENALCQDSSATIIGRKTTAHRSATSISKLPC